MKALKNIGTSISKVMGKTGLKIQKYSPEILLGVGIVGFVGTVVMACVATKKAEKEIANLEEEKCDIECKKEFYETTLAEDPDANEEEIAQELDVLGKELSLKRAETAGKLVLTYAPTIALGTVSIAALVTSRNITHKRYLAAVSAYGALSEVFQTYRKRVIDEYGEKLDHHFRYGTTYRTETETEVDEDGKKTKKKIDVEEIVGDPSGLAKFMDESNPNWIADPNYLFLFLKGQERRYNDMLQSRGHVFLNEVYDGLGFKQTPQGQILGWSTALNKDTYIDFGIFNTPDEQRKQFVNGETTTVLLDFNVDGVIWDKI